MYSDPIARMGAAHPAVHHVNMLDGEDKATGKVYQVEGWFAWSDAARVRFLRQLAESYGEDPRMRWHAARICESAGVQPRDYQGQAAALLHYVQTAVYYTNEPGEQIQSPWRTIAERNGDCDDMALLYAALLESLDFPWKFMLAGRVRGRPARWMEGQPWVPGLEATHIYVAVGLPVGRPSKWLSAEPTVRGLPLGHDVVLHGLPKGVVASDIQSSGTMGAWGAAIDPSQVAAAVTLARGTPSAPTPGLLGWIDWSLVMQRAAEGVAVALAVGLASRYLRTR